MRYVCLHVTGCGNPVFEYESEKKPEIGESLDWSRVIWRGKPAMNQAGQPFLCQTCGEDVYHWADVHPDNLRVIQ